MPLTAVALAGLPGVAVAAGETPPPAPEIKNLGMDGTAPCVSGADRPYRGTAPRLTARLAGHPLGNDSFELVGGEFEITWKDADGHSVTRTLRASEGPSGSESSVTVPAGVPDNATVSWRVRAYHGDAVSAWSDENGGHACEYAYDIRAPEKPTVSSEEFPAETADWLPVLGRHGSFTVRSASADTASYRYWFTGGTPADITPDTLGGAATIPYFVTSEGPITLTVQAADRAGNASPRITYTFRVSSSGPVASWDLTDQAGATSAAATEGPDVPAGEGVTFGAYGPAGTAYPKSARLDGGASGHLATETPVVDTHGSFSAGAWVKPADATGTRTVLSQDAGEGHSFTLGQRATDEGAEWAFTFGGRTVTGGPVEADRWTHVEAVYDAYTGLPRLYVNGTATTAKKAAAPDESASDGAFQIGRARTAAGYGAYWSGSVAAVRVHDRVLVDDEITRAASRAPSSLGLWDFEGLAEDAKSAPATHGGPAMTLHGGTLVANSGTTCPEAYLCAPFPPDFADATLALDGESGWASTTEPVPALDESFTVVAHYFTDDTEPEGPVTVLAQGGEGHEGFRVRYADSTWQLLVTDADGTERMLASTPGHLEPYQVWAQVAVVHDREHGTLRLVVDNNWKDELVASHRFATAGGGALAVGAAPSGEGAHEFLHGAVDNVSAYRGVLDQDDLSSLAFGNEPHFPVPEAS
ncbi:MULTISPECIES: LamG domain-containing protein [unclassified Streptomyces]|uniref:LamG domain-containing protein n=1 Tax=unclassified Streptomyces TaxID=2593676 RepID=UPI000D1B5997|nr:LamG domain-containing protein [Streptomyces sp. CLI2509]MYX18473.1 LamG domain-containing protein [Streptomyces sp. SID8380]